MATSRFQGMTEERSAGMTRARLLQHYRELGFSPEVASQKAEAELAFRGQAPRETMETRAARAANDAITQSRANNDRDLGPENQNRINQMYRSNPMLAGLDEPPAQLDQFHETPAAPGEAARGMPQFSSNPGMRRETFIAPAPVDNTPQYDSPERRAMTPEQRAEQDAQARNRGFAPLQYTEQERYVMTPEGEANRTDQRVRDAEEERARIATSERLSRELGQQSGYATPSQSLTDRALGALGLNTLGSFSNEPSPQTLTGNQPPSPNPRAAIPAQPDGEYGYSGPMGDILQQALDASRGPQGRVPEMLMPLNGAKDPRTMPIVNGNNSPARQNQLNITALPVRRPDSIGQLPGSQPAQQESLLSRIFSMPKDPYEGMSSRKLFDISNKDPDNAAAFFRADKALQKEQPDMFKPKNDVAQPEKRGGPVNGGKDAALHKALEIIHHMLTRGR